MKKKRVGVRFFKAVITCMLLLVVIGLVGGIIFAKKIIDNTPDVSAEDIQPKGFTTTIVDQNGTVIDTLKDSDSNRVYLSLIHIYICQKMFCSFRQIQNRLKIDDLRRCRRDCRI